MTARTHTLLGAYIYTYAAGLSLYVKSDRPSVDCVSFSSAGTLPRQGLVFTLHARTHRQMHTYSALNPKMSIM